MLVKGLGRKFAALALPVAVLTVAAPAVAQAETYNVSGTVCTCGDWSYYDNVRTKATAGNISLAMTNKTAGPTYIALRNNILHGDGHSTPYFFTPIRTFSSTETQVIGVNVPANTHFYLNARMDRQILPFQDHDWAGQLTW